MLNKIVDIVTHQEDMMSVVEPTVEFIVKVEEEPILVPPSIIGMPVAEQAEPITLSAPIKEAVLSWFIRQGQEQRPQGCPVFIFISRDSIRYLEVGPNS